MLVANLPQRQRFWETFAIELRICARARYRPHIDNEIDAGFLKQIDEFDDCPGRVAYGEEAVRVGSNLIMVHGDLGHIGEDRVQLRLDQSVHRAMQFHWNRI